MPFDVPAEDCWEAKVRMLFVVLAAVPGQEIAAAEHMQVVALAEDTAQAPLAAVDKAAGHLGYKEIRGSYIPHYTYASKVCKA